MQEIPIVLIGHKDHGKSTLIGRLILDTKSIKESRLKDVQDVDKAWGRKFELAHLIDSFKEERDREMTIDTARVPLKGKKRTYQLIDVPGHEELIAQMLTGASGAEAALLLVSATEGIKMQTIQHLELAHLLGIEKLGVAVNKMDAVGYKEAVFKKLVRDLRKILKKIGYPLNNIFFFPISAMDGDNVITKSHRIPWYSGPTIINFLENKLKIVKSKKNIPLCFLTQDIYLNGAEKILIGKIESGKLKIGQEVMFLPANKRSKIKSIKDSEDDLEKASTGHNIGIILENNLEIKRGAVGCSPAHDLKVTNKITGEAFWIEKPSQKNLTLECGTASTEGKIQKLKNIETKRKNIYEIQLKSPIVFDPSGKTILSKIAFKDKGKIIGVGNIK